MPVNVFKQALQSGRTQIGLWMGTADPSVAELLANTGFDWLLIDAEHSPNDPRSVLPLLQAMAPYPVHPIVRPVQGAPELIKQYLDIGAQTLLLPMIETAADAVRVVAATRYPTRGIRGVASATTRASRWNRRRKNWLAAATRRRCWFRAKVRSRVFSSPIAPMSCLAIAAARPR